MAEPPVRVSAEGVEAELRKIGHKWVDLILAGSAIVISVVSLAIAVKHGVIMQKLVAANSWPILFFETGNLDDETGEEKITMTVRNDGAGPALLKHLRVTYEGRDVTSSWALVRACCVTAGTKAELIHLGSQRVGQSVIPAGSSTTFITMPRRETNAAEWGRLNTARFKLTYDACYCSVLGECWRSNLTGVEPRKVKQCPSSGGYQG